MTLFCIDFSPRGTDNSSFAFIMIASCGEREDFSATLDDMVSKEEMQVKWLEDGKWSEDGKDCEKMRDA